jgi:GNAT superfamily N-acetyltransferase
MALQVRRAERDSDFRRLFDLLAEYEADLPPDLRHGAVADVGELKAAYGEPNAAFLAELEDAAIGCVAVRRLARDTAVMGRLFVTPAFRRLGAARLLVLEAIRFARAGNYRRVVLDTNKARLKPAYGLYRSLGFAECEPYAGVTYEAPTFMELRIG